MRVTVIDDHPEFLDLMRALLDDGRHQMRGFTAGVSLDELAASQPDVFVMDLPLGEGGAAALDLPQQVRGDRRLQHVPIVVCTGDVATAREHVGELTGLGGLEILERPFDISEMEAVLARLLA